MDFSQVYTSALALRHHASAYLPRSKRFRDHWRRAPGYPPLMNWVAVPLTLLRYDRALLLYTLLSAAGLLAARALVLLRGGERRAIIYVYVVGAQAALCFLTPVGVTHLERGQFDVLVATASALAVGCVFSSRPASLFLVLAFRTYALGSSLSPEAITAAYVVFGLLFLSVSVFIVNAQPHPGSTGSSA